MPPVNIDVICMLQVGSIDRRVNLLPATIYKGVDKYCSSLSMPCQ